MDIIDRAQAIAEVYETAAIKRFLGGFQGVHPTHAGARPSSRKCADCGKPIPQARLKVNSRAERCVPCQDKLERSGS